ncbi:MAG: hypothetical protein K6E76_00590 [Patescibacteria group bacterium]|nr:hypothetical protein [Patescibacteria group bacterium]
MIIQTGEAHGSALTMLGNFLLSSKGTGDIDTNETGAVKTITHCNCYNDGTQWYSVQNTAACNLLCDKKVAECGSDVNTCKSGDLVNKDQENIKGQFWGCEGTTGSTLITVQCVKCHENFTGSIGTGGLDCKEMTQTGACESKNSNGTII